MHMKFLSIVQISTEIFITQLESFKIVNQILTNRSKLLFIKLRYWDAFSVSHWNASAWNHNENWTFTITSKILVRCFYNRYWTENDDGIHTIGIWEQQTDATELYGDSCGQWMKNKKTKQKTKQQHTNNHRREKKRERKSEREWKMRRFYCFHIIHRDAWWDCAQTECNAIYWKCTRVIGGI